MRTLTFLVMVVSAFSIQAAPRVIEVDGDRVVLALAPEDDVRAGEAATLFYARVLANQRVEVLVAEVRIEGCEPLRCRAVVTWQQQPVLAGYEMILHRVRETTAVPAPLPAPAAGAAPAGAEAGEAERAVEALERRFALGDKAIVEVVSSPPGALVQFDGDDVGQAPLAFVLEGVRPGRVAVSLEGYERQEVEVVPRAGETVSLKPLLVRRYRVDEGWRVAGLVATSVGAAMAAAGGTLMVLGSLQHDRAHERYTHYVGLPGPGADAASVATWSEVQDAVDRSRVYGVTGTTLLAAGSAAALFGLVAWLDPFDWFRQALPVATPLPEGGVSLDWRFPW